MNADELEARMRELERFHALRVTRATWPVLRVDGRGFTRLADERFERPFDPRFHELMVKTAETLLVALGGSFAFTESDEISVLLPAGTDLFGREVEKLVSIAAGIASSTRHERDHDGDTTADRRRQGAPARGRVPRARRSLRSPVKIPTPARRNATRVWRTRVRSRGGVRA